ncbi:serine-rich adhesin for platelets-like isoform X2 [Bactrocera neohumeralis]|nr:serine-rich adhesin for platelets-like isoform X2 [Bactrocera neohumeralis]
MSFPLHTLLQQPVNGFYKLQSQACLNRPQSPILLQYPAGVAHPAQVHSQAHQTPSPTSRNNQIPNSNDKFIHLNPHSQPQTAVPETSVANGIRTMTSTLTRQKSEEDVMSIDSMAQATAGNNIEHPMTLSRKALHQRDADENLFLRFLELDPPTDTAAPTNATSATPSASGGRRLSATSKSVGRTPFTMTKKLTRTAERGFGFSIVWTHPPRVEKIEPGLSADRAGIQPGDYVIFVDKQNVVTMPEADVLNLIRSQGSTLTLEVFRRTGPAGGVGLGSMPPALSVSSRGHPPAPVMNGKATPNTRLASTASDEQQSVTGGPTLSSRRVGVPTAAPTITAGPSATFAVTNVRPSTACSGGTTSSIEAAKRRLHLPQVTFSKESIGPITDNRRRLLLQLISREQNFIAALHFGMQRFVQPLQDRKDLISPNDHRTLFQNIDELLRISEDILEQLCNDDQEPQMNFASRVYLSKTTAICAAYKKYCNGIKRADCVLVNKSRQMGSEFVAFITEPQVPRKRPDLTMFIHRPLQHFREILKLMQLLASNCHVDTEEHKNFTTVIAELQAAYREITVSSGLMEPLGEGRPLLTLQDLESRMVFTKCKPFTLAVQGRQWIFGGDLSRVEGRSVKPYWTLLFSDIIVFAKVSRDRVLFITEEPIPIANIVDSCFHMRKKTTEFRLTVDPNGRLAESPTGYCAPDLTRTPKKSARRKSLLLRAPSLELKAVWQNLLQRQIFLVNAALGSTPLSSPLDSPDVLNTLVPLSDIGIASASIGSIKHSSMDSINAKNSQQQKRHSNASEQIEMLIDEKCRILNKTGTSKSNALHLANWMKGQLDKQQEQARLAAQRSRENISHEEEHLLYPENDQDERITFWTRQQLEKRTKELNLAKENGSMKARPNFGGKRLSGVEELSMSDAYSENVSQLSQSHSTTSGSQITVRSSPIVLDKLAVCRHCHKNCQQAALGLQQSMSPAMSALHAQRSAIGAMIAEGSVGGGSGSGLVCTSLKVQHSQSSPNRCCRLNGNASQAGSSTSISSSTITGDQPSEHSSKVVASSSKRETGDTESDVAQLITDDLSQSEATDDSIGGIPSSSSGVAGVDEIQRRLTDSFSKLRILDERREAKGLDVKPGPQPMPRIQDPQHIQQTVFMNGYCLSSSSSGDRDNEKKAAGDKKPQPQPRTYRVTLQTATKETAKEAADKQVKTIVTITETAQIIRTQEQDRMQEQESAHFVDTSRTTTKSPKSPHMPVILKSPKSPGAPASAARFIACNCQCTPADFQNTTLSPDEVEQQTCKLIDSPKQSPQMPRQLQLQGSANSIITEKTHKVCKCICGDQSLVTAKNEHSSFPFNGLSARQFDIKLTPTTPLPTPTSTSAPARPSASMPTSNFVPTIAVVPPTPEALLTMTSTNVWDNSGTNLTTSTTTQLQLNNTPGQAVIENIPEDSCDESPLDEEPPYRPMNNALRRYGTMSSLEKLPSDDRMDGDLDELENDDDKSEVPGDTEEDDDDLDDKARADTVDNMCETSKSSVYSNEVVAGGSCVLVGGVWTSRASGLVGGNKMSFFEESRAFIDKYLGRWNQEQTTSSPAATTSETDEQVDECTSGATSGEEVWGTPTSGGDNDDMHLVNSENTYSSPTKSSNSLNDDDDTELMMDELLMAPPMTASTIRGLLPRRRLEPLFEEETESDEEKTQQESEDVKKGETTTNGHYLKDSAGSSSDEDLSIEKSYELELEEENVNPTPYAPKAQHIHGHIPPPTSIPTSWEQAFAQSQLPLMASKVALPVGVLKASSCEYLLEQRTMVPLRTTSITSSPPTVRANSATPMKATTLPSAKVEVELGAASQQTVTMEVEMKATMRSTTTMMMTTTRTIKTPPSPRNQPPSSISTTINSASASTVKSSCNNGSGSTQTTSTTTVRPAKFVPPPPPPRRLLLTQTNLQTSGMDMPKAPVPPQRSSGASADVGYSADVSTAGESTNATRAAAMPITKVAPSAAMGKGTANQKAAGGNLRSAVAAAVVPKRVSSTIIETSLLGSGTSKAASTLSTTVSKTTKESLQEERQQQTHPFQKIPTEVVTKSTVTQCGNESSKSDVVPAPIGSGLSPRLEMRLALNHDILGDEDLICYDPGPDLTRILGHDLSTFQRRTGRDLLSRSATNRVQPKEAVISFSQQRNSKMDTPTVNRRPRPTYGNVSTSLTTGLVGGARVGGAPQPLLPNRNTWSNSVSADQNSGVYARGDENSKNYNYSSDESKLSDLEILARREKTYCMSQLKSGSRVKTKTTATATTTTMAMETMAVAMNRDSLTSPQATRKSTSSMGMEIESANVRSRKIGRDESALIEAGKGSRLINFIKRRNSESPTSPNCSQSSLSESNASGTPVHRLAVQMSPRKDNDKPSLNRRLWKQITKRRRANSVSEVVAS